MSTCMWTDEALPLLIAYHIVCINYGDIAADEDALAYCAALNGLDEETCYQHLCAFADELGPAPGACSH